MRRDTTRLLATLAFAGGALVGGCLLGFVAYLFGAFAVGLPDWLRAAAVAGAFVVATLRDFGWVRVRLPEYSAQVPRDIYRHGIAAGSWVFGVFLGLALRTRIPGSFFYAFMVLLVLGGFTPAGALVAGGLFGLGRAAVPLRRLVAVGRTGGVTQPTFRLASAACAVVGTSLAAALALRPGL